MAESAAFSDFFYPSRDGLRLHARVYGAEVPGRLPLVCLPGLTRNARDFHELAQFLSRHPKTPRKVISFEYRGRGGSAYDPDWKNYAVGVEAGDVLAGLSALGVEQAAFIGTSRGGLILHVLAAMRPEVLKTVILNDIGPVVEAEGLAHIRAYLSDARTPATFPEAIRLQQAVHGAAFPALTDEDWARMAAAIYRDDGGRPVADYDPALINTVIGLDLSRPLPALWEPFAALATSPLMVIRGENSRLLSAETVAEMRRRHPTMQVIVVAGQGHPPLLETGELPRRIFDFLIEADSTAAS